MKVTIELNEVKYEVEADRLKAILTGNGIKPVFTPKRIGMKFYDTQLGAQYILTGDSSEQTVFLANIETGKMYLYSVPVKDDQNITEEEWQQISGTSFAGSTLIEIPKFKL